MWFSSPWRGICFQLPLSRSYELQGTQCQGCHSQGYWLLLGACGLGTREGFCWKFSTESFLWEGNPRKVTTKKGKGCDPVIGFVGPGSSHKFGEIAIFSAIDRGPMSLHLWLDPGPTLSLISENLKIECEDGFPCSSRMGNDGSWRDGVFQKSSPTSETWLFQICETFENWYMIMEKRHLKMYFPLRMVDFF